MTMTWPAMLAAYETTMGLTHRPDTLRTRMSYLRRFADTMPLECTEAQVVAWLAERDHWAQSTRKGGQGALRSFYRWAYRAGHVAHDPTRDLPPITVPQTLPRPATEEQVAAGRAVTCPDRLLMVELAAQHGLRRSEIAGLRRSDLTPDGLHVVGKGGKHRLVPVTAAVRHAIASRPAGFVFPGRFAGHVHPSTVQRWVRDASGVSPHPHRHRFATRGYRGTRNLFAVQQVLGHKSASTTQIYVKLDMDALASVIDAAA
jgi:site-specific recombinase XerC